MSDITCKELFEESKNKKLNLIDVRSPAEYESCHIPFAELFPLQELDAKAIEKHFGAGSTLYVVCHSGGRSKVAQEKLRAETTLNVINVLGGTKEWTNSGFPSAEGKKSLPMEQQVRIIVGILNILSIFGGWFISSRILFVPLFMGIGLIYSGLTGSCAMATLLAKAPWNSARTQCSFNSQR